MAANPADRFPRPLPRVITDDVIDLFARLLNGPVLRLLYVAELLVVFDQVVHLLDHPVALRVPLQRVVALDVPGVSDLAEALLLSPAVLHDAEDLRCQQLVPAARRRADGEQVLVVYGTLPLVPLHLYLVRVEQQVDRVLEVEVEAEITRLEPAAPDVLAAGGGE